MFATVTNVANEMLANTHRNLYSVLVINKPKKDKKNQHWVTRYKRSVHKKRKDWWKGK
jgi:hypothetical protein